MQGQPHLDPVHGEGSDGVLGAAAKVRVVNVPNLLTGFRIVLVPVFLFALFADGGDEPRWRITAFVIFAVASITDQLDGALARSYGLVTEFGKLADPIADKALTGAALIGLSMLGDLSWWITIVIVVRELGVTVLRFAVLRRGVIPASRGGKLKTLVQGIAIGLLVLPLAGWWLDVANIVMAIAVVLTVITGFDYVVGAVRDARLRPIATIAPVSADPIDPIVAADPVAD